MTHYLNCNNKTEYREALSVFNYYGFDVKYNGMFNQSCQYNLFIADIDSLKVIFTNEIDDETSITLTNINDFEDECLKQKVV